MTESADPSDAGIVQRVRQTVCSHDWLYRWSDREKECWDCGLTKPIEKEYHHADDEAEIGETRLQVVREDDAVVLMRERYKWRGHGPDDAQFKWMTDGRIRLSRQEYNQVVDDDPDDTEWFIHRFRCPDCDTISRADRAVACFKCGTQMEHVERIGEVYDTFEPESDESE